MRNILFFLVFLSACSQAEDDLRERIQTGMNKTYDDVEVTAVRKAPMDGMVEVELNGQDRLYATEDGRFLFTGNLLEVTGDGVRNITEERLDGVRAEAIRGLKADEMISFPSENQKAEIYAFTDISCGYCQRLHQDMSRLNSLGITVHYLAFPRGGMSGRAAEVMQKIWCAEDRHSALTEAKLGNGTISEDPEACEDPVEEQYQLGLSMGVRGTPAIYAPTGEQLGGYLPPRRLAAALGLEGPAKAD